MKHLLLPLTALLSVTLGISCGGDDDSSDSPGGGGSSCSLTAACGGDLTGDWTIASFCPDTSKIPLQVKDACPTATLDYAAPKVSGTMTFEGGMFTQTASATGTGYLVLDKACVEDVSLDCAQVEDVLNENSGGPTLDCKPASGGGCRCATDIADPAANDQGAYAISGSKLTLTGATGDEVESTYCVQSDKLYLTLNLNAGSSGKYSFVGQLALTKKN